MKKLAILLILVAGCKKTTSSAPTTPTNPTDPPATIAVDLLNAHNQERMKEGAGPLALEKRLITAAEKHAKWMYENKKMSHTGAGGSTFSQRIKAEGYNFSAGGENIANGYSTVSAVMNGWMNSSGHKANILSNRYRQCGFGRVGNYWCAVFASPSGQIVIQDVETSEPEPLKGPEPD